MLKCFATLAAAAWQRQDSTSKPWLTSRYNSALRWQDCRYATMADLIQVCNDGTSLVEKLTKSIFCRCASRRPEQPHSVLPRNHPTPISLLSPWPSTQGKRHCLWGSAGKKAVHNCFSPYKQMTLSEIYFWIMSTFPYYKANR